MDQKSLFGKLPSFRKTKREGQGQDIEGRAGPSNFVREEASVDDAINLRIPTTGSLSDFAGAPAIVQPAQFQGAENTVMHNPHLTNVAGNYVVVNNHYTEGIEHGNDTSTSVSIPQGRSGSGRKAWPRQAALPVSKSSDIYYRHLAAEERGYPLWIPEPNNRCPIEYQRKGVSIGDVGVITPSGSFDFLFNICLPADHPINMNEVPDDFAPLDPPLKPHDIRGQLEFRSDSYITSASITRTTTRNNGGEESQGLSFETMAVEGAILTIPNGAVSEDLANVTRLRRYTGNNTESWYRYSNGPRGRDAKNGDIRLVVGVDKTNAWGMATFANMTDQSHVFRLKFTSNGQGSTGSKYRWEHSEHSSGRAQVRAGPDAREIEALQDEREEVPRAYENQCLFVRTLNATLSDEVWERLSAEIDVMEDLYNSSQNNPKIQLLNGRSLGSSPESSPQNNSSQSSGRHTKYHGDQLFSEGSKERAGSVTIEDLPAARTSHPSKALNEALLRQFPTSKMAITEDSDWIIALIEQRKQEGRAKILPPPEDLVPLVLSLHSIKNEGDVIFLERADSSRLLISGGTNLDQNQLSDPNRLSYVRSGDFNDASIGSAINLPLSDVKASLSKEISVSTSSDHLIGPVKEATTDPRIIVNLDKSGVVVTATLEGLVDHLIHSIENNKEAEYCDILLNTYADFTTAEDIFEILFRRFFEAESESNQEPLIRASLQHNILAAVKYCLSNEQHPFSRNLLSQIRSFCVKVSLTMDRGAIPNALTELSQLVHSRLEVVPALGSSPLSSREKLQASQIAPKDLAISLTLLAGDKYTALLPYHYIAYLEKHRGDDKIEQVYTLTKETICWIQESVLHYDNIEQRADGLRFFIHTAEECRRLRNFSSLAAIASALHSAPIARLRLTRTALQPLLQTKLNGLADIINPASGYRNYREALADVSDGQEPDRCIPWLDAHLKELDAVLWAHPRTVLIDGRPLLNFARYVAFTARIRAALPYRPPDLEQHRQSGPAGYLEQQLRNLRMSPPSAAELTARSQALEMRENVQSRTRHAQLQSLGFKPRDDDDV